MKFISKVIGVVIVAACCSVQVVLAGLMTNPSFEEPRYALGGPSIHFPDEGLVPGWEITSEPNVIEIWSDGFNGVTSFDQGQHVELNGEPDFTIYQDAPDIAAGSRIDFSFAHRGRAGLDTMRLTITDLGIDLTYGTEDDCILFIKEYSTGSSAWAQYSSVGEPPILARGGIVRFAYSGIASAGSSSIGNFLDAADYTLTAPPCGLVNPSFEEPRYSPGVASIHFPLEDDVPGWSTAAADNQIETWTDGFNGVTSFDQGQHVELNGDPGWTIYQDVTGVPADLLINFSFAHRARAPGTDTMRLTITDLGPDGIPDGGNDVALFVKDYSTGLSWVQYTSASEPPIATLGNAIRFAYSGISSNGGTGIGNFLDAANFTCSSPCGTAPVETTTVGVGIGITKTDLILGPNIPNPFRAATTIRFRLTESSKVSLRVYDITGRVVRTLIEGSTLEPGDHESVWDGKADGAGILKPGVYFYELRRNGHSQTRRAILMR
jgi:hypothetical protein